MKLAVLIAALAIAFANAGPVSKDISSQRYLEYTDENGEIQIIDLEAEPDWELLEEIEKSSRNRYLLFTRRNEDSPQELVMDDADSIYNSNFNAGMDTVVIVHGWLGNQEADLNPVITKAYLDKREANVIILDWGRVARSGYVTAVRGVPGVGRALGQFLNFLNSVTGADFSNMHLVGFSLGAHVVGNAGRETTRKVARVTGLDPAGPLFYSNSNRIKRGDAEYVEGIHTDGSVVGLGIGSAIGDVDFFPNGGNSQPGCLTSICHHNRAWEFFAATVTYNHLIGNECFSNLQISLNNCKGQAFHMGNDILYKRGIGLYRVNTSKRYPF